MRVYKVVKYGSAFRSEVYKFRSFAKAAMSIKRGDSFEMYEERILNDPVDIAHYLENPKFKEVDYVTVTGTMLPPSGKSYIVVNHNFRSSEFERHMQMKTLIPAHISRIVFNRISISHNKVYAFQNYYHKKERFCTNKCGHQRITTDYRKNYVICDKHTQLVTVMSRGECKFRVKKPEWCK